MVELVSEPPACRERELQLDEHQLSRAGWLGVRVPGHTGSVELSNHVPGTEVLEDCFDRWEGAQARRQTSPAWHPARRARYRTPGRITGTTGTRQTSAASARGRPVRPGCAKLVEPIFTSAPYQNASTSDPFASISQGQTQAEGTSAGFNYTISINASQIAAAAGIYSANLPNASSGAPGFELVGIEDGLEGENGATIQGTVSGLQAYTSYTSEAPPSVTTGGVSDSTGSRNVALTGSLTANGGTDTSYYFQYGTSTSYGSTTASEPAAAQTGPQNVSTTISTLAPSTTYHYRLVASDWQGQSVAGADQSFTTPSPPANTSVPTMSPLQPYIGQAVTATNGGWTNSPTSYTYGWYSCGATACSEVQSGSTNSYTPADADSDASLYVSVAASNAWGAGTANSARTGPVRARQVLSLDVNGDGRPDIAELEPDPSNPGRYRWLWLQNNGGGNFTLGGVLYSDLEPAAAVVSFDVNGDGRPDIAELEPDPSNPGRYRWLWLQNNGGGNFTLGGVLFSDLLEPLQAVSLDVNGDGRPDIAELEPDPSNPGRYRWLWLQNNGGGNFTLGGVLFSDLLEPLQAVSLDVNGDGRPDIAELEPDPSNPGRYRWPWLQNNGGGNFTLGGVLFSDLLEPLQAVSLDVNGDGRPDIAELEPDPSNPGRYRWLWLQNNGGGNFAVGGVAFNDLQPAAAAVTIDATGSGRSDLAELEPDPANAGRQEWLWLQNNGGATSRTVCSYSDLEQPVQALALDVDGDGKPDIAE